MIIIDIEIESTEYKRERDVYASAIHMKRSVACFACECFYPDYYSVDTHQGIRNTARSFYPDWKTACTWQAIFNEWIGLMVYRIMGYC